MALRSEYGMLPQQLSFTPPLEEEEKYPAEPNREKEEEFVEKMRIKYEHLYVEGAKEQPDSKPSGTFTNVDSYCRIYGNVFLGNQASACASANQFYTGACRRGSEYKSPLYTDVVRINKFGAVFNVSASESGTHLSGGTGDTPFSLHEDFAKVGIDYDTSQDEHGVTMPDGNIVEIADVKKIASQTQMQLSFGFSAPPKLVAEYPRKIWLNAVPYSIGAPAFAKDQKEGNSEKAFINMMYNCADRIDTLVKRNADKNVLVHCFGGYNRSACAVAAYLFLNVMTDKSMDDIIALIRTTVMNERGIKSESQIREGMKVKTKDGKWKEPGKDLWVVPVLTREKFLVALRKLSRNYVIQEQQRVAYQAEYRLYMTEAIALGVVFNEDGVPIKVEKKMNILAIQSPFSDEQHHYSQTLRQQMEIAIMSCGGKDIEFRCGFCDSRKKRMMKCSCCTDPCVYYCSPVCQTKDWEHHRHNCCGKY